MTANGYADEGISQKKRGKKKSKQQISSNTTQDADSVQFQHNNNADLTLNQQKDDNGFGHKSTCTTPSVLYEDAYDDDANDSGGTSNAGGESQHTHGSSTNGNGDSRSRSSSNGSMMSTMSLDKACLSSGCPTPLSEYLAFQQPFTSVSFSCGGWLQFYLFGVARAFQAMGIHKDVKWAGCSAGALAAAGIALDGDFDAAIEFCKRECLPRTNSVRGLLSLDEYVSSCIDSLLISKYHDLEPGELQVAITKFPYLSGVRVTEHHGAQDLKETLLASAAAYPAAQIHNHSRFGLCIDGGLSDFQPVLDGDTVTVSPFYFSDCDIRPSRYVPPWWAFVPPKDEDTVDWTYNLGYEDAMRYIKKQWNVGKSPHSVRHLRKGIDRNTDHDFDTPRRITVHRFLGYNPKKLTMGNAIGFLCDLVLLLMFVLLLKPVALLLIYAELFLNSLSTGAEIVVGSTVVLFAPIATLVLSIFNVKSQKVSVFKKPSVIKSLEHTATKLLGEAVRRRRARDLQETLSCILSLSLLLRFFSSFNRPSNTDLRKHDKLYKHSILYRILRHAV